jgi:two-component system, OmpR family, KDP operon response regulator KdpE
MSQPARILVVEDDDETRRALLFALETYGHHVSLAPCAAAAVEQARLRRHDLVLLDLGLPDGDGRELIPILRSLCDSLVVVSATHDVSTKVAAFEAGADDYVTKPFSARELLARVEARRRVTTGTVAPPARVLLGNVEVDFVRRLARRDGAHIALRRREWQLLEVIAHSGGQYIQPDELVTAVWGDETDVTFTAVYTTVRRLRAALEQDPGAPRYLVGERGLGYALRAD